MTDYTNGFLVVAFAIIIVGGLFQFADWVDEWPAIFEITADHNDQDAPTMKFRREDVQLGGDPDDPRNAALYFSNKCPRLCFHCDDTPTTQCLDLCQLMRTLEYEP